MKTIQRPTTKVIKNELQTAFPHTKFLVRSRKFSGGYLIIIQWEDGPVEEQTYKILNKYEQGNYIFENRIMSKKTETLLTYKLEQYLQINMNNAENVKQKTGFYPDELLLKEFDKQSFEP